MRYLGVKSFHVFTARLIQTETKTTTTCCLLVCLNGSDGLSLKHGNGPNPSKPSRGLHEHLGEAYAKHTRVCLPPVYSCTGTEETSMVHCSFHHVLKVLLDSFQVATHNYASLPTRDTAMFSYAVAYANFRPQSGQPTQHQEQFHFCINSFIDEKNRYSNRRDIPFVSCCAFVTP